MAICNETPSITQLIDQFQGPETPTTKEFDSALNAQAFGAPEVSSAELTEGLLTALGILLAGTVDLSDRLYDLTEGCCSIAATEVGALENDGFIVLHW
ncbi:hypothetical protein [Ferrimonas kyonanensis]|uniref:hypothetical protein n=1 Tax=Ferrimonas kyonanensis TaxID=364763 RepID=UPI0003F7AEDA|nr:hypothetical protein [Ferrimonas kyonanensis]